MEQQNYNENNAFKNILGVLPKYSFNDTFNQLKYITT